MQVKIKLVAANQTRRGQLRAHQFGTSSAHLLSSVFEQKERKQLTPGLTRKGITYSVYMKTEYRKPEISQRVTGWTWNTRILTFFSKILPSPPTA